MEEKLTLRKLIEMAQNFNGGQILDLPLELRITKSPLFEIKPCFIAGMHIVTHRDTKLVIDFREE